MKVTDMACDKVMIIHRKCMKKPTPVSIIPDVKFDNPVIIVIRAGKIKVQDGEMHIVKKGYSLMVRVVKISEQLLLIKYMTALEAIAEIC